MTPALPTMSAGLLIGRSMMVKVDLGGGVFVANVADGTYFADPLDSGDKVTASWDAADVNVLTKVDTGDAGDPYLDAMH